MRYQKPLPLSDPEIFSEYTTNGMTYRSDDNNIIPRDSAGSIVIEPTSNKNILVIEPIVKRITNNSFLKVYNTAFQYYKFPVATIEPGNAELTVNIDNLDFVDTISTRYIIPYKEYPDGVPSDYARINTSTKTSWFTNGAQVLEGFLPLPLTGPNQTKPYSFILTGDIIDILKSSNKTIKFYIQAQFTPDNQSLNTAFRIRLLRTNSNVTQYKNDNLAELKTETKGEYNSGDYPVLTLEYILDVNTMSDYDTFVVEAVSGNPAWCLGNQTIWNIDVIDKPVDDETGVISISGKTSLIINGITVIDGRV